MPHVPFAYAHETDDVKTKTTFGVFPPYPPCPVAELRVRALR